MRFRPSLYARLTLALLGPLLLAMVAAWAIGVRVVTQALEQRVEGQSRNAAAVLATWGLPYTPELLRRLALLQRADFTLVDTTGRVVFSTSESVGRALAAPLAGFASNPPSAPAAFKLDEPASGIAVYQPIDASHDPRYSALVAVAPLGDVEAAARRATWWLGLAMLAAGAVLGALLLGLVRNITRPLAQLADMADRIAAGEREQRMVLPRADEIGAVAESLNSMMLRLRGYEERLASRSRLSALGEMSARLAHEIRNPLTGLKLHLQLFAERVDPRESARVQQLLGEVQRLELLVSTTLMLGREQPLTVEVARIEPLVTDVIDLMGPSLAHRGIRADSRCDPELAVGVDRARLRQALLNLIVNAADAMPQGGQLLVAAEHDIAAGRAMIVVEDSGPGVSDEVLQRLPDDPVSTKPFGLGLGLTMCRDVAAAHGGELRVERSAVLGGARIVIALPLSPASPGAATDG